MPKLPEPPRSLPILLHRQNTVLRMGIYWGGFGGAHPGQAGRSKHWHRVGAEGILAHLFWK